jgi:hypothetical protein
VKVFPAIYPWVTHGITSLLEMVFKQGLAQLQQGRPISPYIQEFGCALERALAYAHTGNAKVLSSGVMGPLFMIRGMVQHGMPTINKAVYQTPIQSSMPFIVHSVTWPLTKSKKYPAICTKRSHILNYGEEYYMVSHPVSNTAAP